MNLHIGDDCRTAYEGSRQQTPQSHSRNVVLCGDCLEVLQGFPDHSIDAIVTDPPYGLSFMGKDWDHGVPGVQFWEELLRVAKPGAHLLAFGGTRTHHRLMVAIEDAGWELRDTLMWVYGSGWPKNHDIGKAIDKVIPRLGQFGAFAKHFAQQRKASGLSQKEIALHFPSKTGGITGCVWNWENGANVPTVEQWHILQPLLNLSTEYLPLIQRIETEREIVGKKRFGERSGFNGVFTKKTCGLSKTEVDITVPATDAAKQWDGWGTALKPSWEPIILARKPLDGTVAETVLKWGCGGLNIEGCRIGTENVSQHGRSDSENSCLSGRNYAEAPGRSWIGRWPATLLIDEVAADLLDQQSGTLKSGANPARFFYTAKATTAERGKYLNGKNDHPTVKPVALMRYLCRLITPPGGVVLDPFCGSGSTGVAAFEEGFDYILIDKDPTSCETAKKRNAGKRLTDFW